MSEKRFEEGFEHSNYDYTLLNTHYEARENKIIEWNKHSSNAEYFNNDLEGIAELLNIKQMKLEGVEKYDVRIGELFDKIERLELENENLRKQMKSFETTMNATSDYNAYLQSEVKDLEKENGKLRKQVAEYNMILRQHRFAEKEGFR